MKLVSKVAAALAVASVLTVSSYSALDMVSIAGDANLDSNVNLSDVSTALKSIAGWNVSIAEANADVNTDGVVTLSDVSHLLKHLAKWDTEMPSGIAGLSSKDGSYYYDLTDKQDSALLLDNPDKGLYIHYLDNGLNRYGVKNGEYLMPEDLPEGLPIDHIYIRIAWCHIEPEEGKFNWELIDNIIDPWIAAGVKVAFRITCKETDASQYYATPEWVKDAGASGKELADAWEPLWNDEIFLEKLRAFHLAFAERYDSNPSVIYIDIGSIGDWGEGHTTFGSNEQYSYDTLLQHMEIYTEAYKNTRIVINDDMITHAGIKGQNRNDLLTYIEEHNFSVRDDSIATKWHYDQYEYEDYGKTSVKVPAVFQRYSAAAPMVLELDHYGNTVEENNDTWLGGKTLLSAIKQTNATYAGFHYYPVDWYNDGNREITGELVNSLGYWYFPESFTFAETDTGMKYEVTLSNKGSAKSYNDYSAELVLVNGDKTVSVNDEGFLSSEILPGSFGKAVFEGEMLDSGEWTAYFRMRDADGREIKLAMNDECYSADYGYKAGVIKLK